MSHIHLWFFGPKFFFLGLKGRKCMSQSPKPSRRYGSIIDQKEKRLHPHSILAQSGKKDMVTSTFLTHYSVSHGHLGTLSGGQKKDTLSINSI